MSLINDALKKAGETSAPPPPLPPLPGKDPGKISLRAEPQSNGLPLPLIIFPLILALILALAGYFLFHGLDRKASGGWRGSVHKVAARESVAPNTVPEVAPAASTNPKTAAAPALATKAPGPVATNVVTSIAPLPTATSPGSSPQLKVQGIFYRAKNPAAMINSKTVFVGDRVSDAKVVAIAPDSVTVEIAGQKKVLSLY
jgi:hypothetical protein